MRLPLPPPPPTGYNLPSHSRQPPTAIIPQECLTYAAAHLRPDPPLPELIFQWDGSASIDRINARWVYRAHPPQTDPAEPTPLPDAVLEIFQSRDAGPADPAAADLDEPDDPDEPARNGHHYSPDATSEPALEKASAALIAAGWTLLDEYTNKDFQHYYFQPPPDQAWRPSRRLFILDDPYAVAEPDPADPDPS